MTLNDVEILAKKIVIGVVIYLIPVIIIFGGLWLTSTLLKKDKQLAGKDYTVQP
ncbi:MAG: hypothetical protein JWM14_2695 [Chitinophagaceae bacterium]|nr:hypothetical protein [Chitinophagaceae bacterium]